MDYDDYTGGSSTNMKDNSSSFQIMSKVESPKKKRASKVVDGIKARLSHLRSPRKQRSSSPQTSASKSYLKSRRQQHRTKEREHIMGLLDAHSLDGWMDSDEDADDVGLIAKTSFESIWSDDDEQPRSSRGQMLKKRISQLVGKADKRELEQHNSNSNSTPQLPKTRKKENKLKKKKKNTEKSSSADEKKERKKKLKKDKNKKDKNKKEEKRPKPVFSD
jgi:hypothetical protein